MPIFRRTNFIITASGIATVCKRLYSMPDESRRKQFEIIEQLHCKVKPSFSRPGQALGLQGVEAPRISRQMANEGDKVAPDVFTPRKYSWYSFLLETEYTLDEVN